MKRIRVDKGLADSVYSQFIAHIYPGTFQVALQTGNFSALEAIALVLDEMRRIRREPVSDEELETAKKYLTGSFPLRLGTQAQRAAFLAQTEYYGLGLDYPDRFPFLIRSVSREDVLRVAKQYLKPEAYVLSVVGNLEKIDEP